MSRLWMVLWCVVILSLMICQCDTATKDSTVSTTYGNIRGSSSETTRHFFGIPYAKPPIGPLRFNPPQKPSKWFQVLDATAFKSMCAQTNVTHVIGSEDCLYLNVYTPLQLNPNSLSPVLVFFHGGAFSEGRASLPLYNADYFVNHGVLASVVVTVNYRLGPLGFLQLPSLKDLNGHQGNYGILDQVAALEWIRSCISSFGGNPEKVTIFGVGAGGDSVLTHIVSPLSIGLFHRAVMGPSVDGFTIPSQDEVNTRASIFLKRVGCFNSQDEAAEASCLRQSPIEKLLEGTELTLGAAKRVVPCGGSIFEETVVPPIGVDGNVTIVEFSSNPTSNTADEEAWFPWGITIDGIVLPDTPLQLLREKKYSFGVPVIFGVDDNSAAIDVYQAVYGGNGKLDKTQSYSSAVHQLFPNSDDAEVIMKQYPGKGLLDQSSAIIPLSQLESDRYYVCPTQRLAKEFTLHGSSVYMYYFSIAISGYELGAHRGSILPLIFGTWHILPGRDLTAYERAASEAIIFYFKNFMMTGNPNEISLEISDYVGVKFPEWPSFSILDSGTSIKTVNMPELLFTRHGTFVGGSTDAGSRDCGIWDNMACIWQTERIAISKNLARGDKRQSDIGEKGKQDAQGGASHAPVASPYRFEKPPSGSGLGIGVTGVVIFLFAVVGVTVIALFIQRHRQTEAPRRGYERVESVELPPMAYMKK